MTQGRTVPGVVTGKPLLVGGSAGRRDATGRGLVYVLSQAVREAGLELRGARVAIQGFGNVGSVTARLLWREGALVTAVADAKGGVFNSRGLDIRALALHAKDAGTVAGFPDADPITNADLLELPCDVLVPAALGGQITEQNADRVRAKIIAEGANGPTTPEADGILNDRGVRLIPDILANAGGVIVSYFEWVQDLQFYFWEEHEVNERLHRVITKAYRDVADTAKQHGCSLRQAAMVLAVGRVVEAARVRGIYP
jgi:glutamate dehydrogenase (NAD(P)+)